MSTFQEIISNESGQPLCRFVIEKSLQKADIDTLKQDLFFVVEEHDRVQIVIRRLEELELPALQWIMAFQRAVQTEGKYVSLDLELTDSLQTLVHQSGLSTKFNCQ